MKKIKFYHHNTGKGRAHSLFVLIKYLHHDISKLPEIYLLLAFQQVTPVDPTDQIIKFFLTNVAVFICIHLIKYGFQGLNRVNFRELHCASDKLRKI